MKILFVVPPLLGHVTPLVAVARQLRARRQRTAWVGGSEELAALEPHAQVFPPRGRPHPGAGPAAVRPDGLRGFAALKYLWEEALIPLADRMVDDVDRAVTDWAPDLIVADQQALAGPLVAQRHGLPWVTSASTSTELADPLASMPKVAQWLADLQAGLRARHGVPGSTDLRFSPHLLLAFSTPALAGQVAVDSPIRFVGPARRTAVAPPAAPRERPLVVVTMGTSNTTAAAGFLDTVRQALAAPALAGRVDAVVLDGVGGSKHDPDLPALLASASAVVCHGGHNTVCEALAGGVPLVVAPIRDDQPMVAAQVEAAGAGIRIRFDRATPATVVDALVAVLDEPGYRVGAEIVARSFRAAGGAAAAADVLEQFATRSRQALVGGRRFAAADQARRAG